MSGTFACPGLPRFHAFCLDFSKKPPGNAQRVPPAVLNKTEPGYLNRNLMARKLLPLTLAMIANCRAAENVSPLAQ
jgi:hypothetical protein